MCKWTNSTTYAFPQFIKSTSLPHTPTPPISDYWFQDRWSALKCYFTFFHFIMGKHFFSLLLTGAWDINMKGMPLKGMKYPKFLLRNLTLNTDTRFIAGSFKLNCLPWLWLYLAKWSSTETYLLLNTSEVTFWK